jgi:hypothetical protein
MRGSNGHTLANSVAHGLKDIDQQIAPSQLWRPIFSLSNVNINRLSEDGSLSRIKKIKLSRWVVTMASFGPQNARFDKFLFATVVERNDLALSVFSMLARLDVDPWQEASRLSELSKAEAINSLSATIWKTNNSSVSATEAADIAAELVGLLPPRDQFAALATTEQSADFFSVWVICVVFFVMVALADRAPKVKDGDMRVEASATQSLAPISNDTRVRAPDDAKPPVR